MAYIKQEWTSGEVISSEKLNYIEQGIEGLSDDIDSLVLDSNGFYLVKGNADSINEYLIFDKTWNQCYEAFKKKPVYIIVKLEGTGTEAADLYMGGFIVQMWAEYGTDEETLDTVTYYHIIAMSGTNPIDIIVTNPNQFITYGDNSDNNSSNSNDIQAE